jgi:hypothetical protein
MRRVTVTQREQVVKVPRDGGHGFCHALWHHLADICFWQVCTIADIDLCGTLGAERLTALAYGADPAIDLRKPERKASHRPRPE